MAIRHITKKIKLIKIASFRNAPRWVDIKKFGLKKARTRRVNVGKIKRWRATRVRI